jgi:hexulose-6-phosphate isomerase
MLKTISAWAFDPARTPAELFQSARELGFEGVEVSIADKGFPLSRQVSFSTPPEEAARVREAADAAGIKLASVASGFGWDLPITTSDEELRRKAVETTKAAIQMTSYLGIDAILLVPGGVGAEFISGFKGEPYDAAYENAIKSLKEIAPVAEEYGVSVGVENVWNKFLLSPLEFRNFLQEVNSPRVGCYFDVGNVVLTGYPEQWVRILGSYITRVHFKDFKRSIGTLDGFCPLLEGDVNYPEVIKALQEVGYDGPVTAEFFNVEDQLPAISKAMDQILGR